MMKIPFSPPDITDEEIDEVVDTLQSGWITTGPKTKKFENMITKFCISDRTVCLDSCTSALEMTLRILGVKRGDEVIVPAYTYTATASAVCHVGATPILVDCMPNSVQMDYDKLPYLINSRTNVIIPVDLGGVPCDYDRVFEIVEQKRNLFIPVNPIQEAFGRIIILADAAHSIGAKRVTKRGTKRVGTLADFTAFSFHAVKNLTTGAGGAVTWRKHPDINSDEIYKQYMLLSLHGQSKDALAKTQLGSWEYDIIGTYFKCNMTDIMASIGMVQLKRLPEMLKRRREIIEFYNRELSDQSVSVLQHYSEKEFISSGHLYLVKLMWQDEEYRNMVIERMAGYGVATNVHYKPLPMMTAYKRMGYNIKDFPNAFNMYKNEITLPLYSKMTDEQAQYVIESFKRATRD